MLLLLLLLLGCSLRWLPPLLLALLRHGPGCLPRSGLLLLLLLMRRLVASWLPAQVRLSQRRLLRLRRSPCWLRGLRAQTIKKTGLLPHLETSGFRVHCFHCVQLRLAEHMCQANLRVRCSHSIIWQPDHLGRCNVCPRPGCRWLWGWLITLQGGYNILNSRYISIPQNSHAAGNAAHNFQPCQCTFCSGFESACCCGRSDTADARNDPVCMLCEGVPGCARGCRARCAAACNTKSVQHWISKRYSTWPSICAGCNTAGSLMRGCPKLRAACKSAAAACHRLILDLVEGMPTAASSRALSLVLCRGCGCEPCELAGLPCRCGGDCFDSASGGIGRPTGWSVGTCCWPSRPIG